MPTFNEAGIPSGVLVAPLMPGINDSPEQVEEIVSIAEEAGATFVNGIALHLRPGVREVFMSWLRPRTRTWSPRYESLYARGAYAPAGRAQADREADPRRRTAQATRGSACASGCAQREARRERAERRAAPPQISLF